MRNGVMDVQEIEIVKLRNFRHAGGERQIIRRIVKEWIPRDFHLVVVNVALFASQPDRLRVRNEVDFVIALGQFHSEFGRDYSTAAIRRITSDADFHVRAFASPVCSMIRWLEWAADADFTRVAGEWNAPSRDSARVRSETHPRVEFVEMRLEPLLGVFGKTREFDSHAHAGVARTNHSAR